MAGRRRVLFSEALLMIGLTLTGLDCDATPRGSGDRNNLSAMETVTINISDSKNASHSFTLWLARTNEEQMLGLMNVGNAELGQDRGMLFIFDRDEPRSFWMRNTIIPLDIAYIRSDGTIVRVLTMQALDESPQPSIEPARMALEVAAGTFGRLGIGAGYRLTIPASVLNRAP